MLGVWIHPDDPQGSHVFAGTHSGVYESKDGAESWQVVSETASWGAVMSFREATIDGKQYIIANGGDGIILTRPLASGTWQKIQAPDKAHMASNMYLSVVTTAGKSEVLTCLGGWGGGKLYYGALDSPTAITWDGPLMTQNGTAIDCANAAVDPNNRDHFVYSKAGEYKAWHSEDGGKTVYEYFDQKAGVYFVMIDKQGDYYTATQAGAFVSEDKGATWDPYHVRITLNPDHEGNPRKDMDRVPHDYQNIIPDFRGDQIAFPSDQGLHIVNRSSEDYTLISACGDLHNTMSLSAIVSPSKDGKSRNIVSNIWDWDVAVSWNDGKSWQSWAKDEKNANSIGEGGGGSAMGTSPHQVMFHRSTWYASSDGGHNWVRGTAPGSLAGGFDYIRAAGSRTEPAGTCFAIMNAPDLSSGSNVKWLMTSPDFGNNYTWVKMPADLQATSLTADPTSATDLFATTSSCLSQSTNLGKDWSPCSKATGLTGSFSQLIIKDSTTMFMLRSGAVPLRTTDSGKTWTELTKAAPLFAHGATFSGALSWSGKTLVLHGKDLSAITRGAYPTAVWKTVDDGETWTDETGDLVTISPGDGVWYDKDFYLATSGEGLCIKRDFEK